MQGRREHLRDVAGGHGDAHPVRDDVQRPCALHGSLGVQSRLPFTLEKPDAGQRLGRLPHHRLEQPRPALLRERVGREPGDEDADRLAAGGERHDGDRLRVRRSEHRVRLGRRPVVLAREPEAAARVEDGVEEEGPGGVGVRRASGALRCRGAVQQPKPVVAVGLVDGAGARAENGLHLLAEEGADLGGRARRPERGRERVQTAQVPGELLRSDASSLLVFEQERPVERQRRLSRERVDVFEIRRAKRPALGEGEPHRTDSKAADGERDREPGAVAGDGRDLREVDRELLGRAMDDHLVPRHRLDERGARRAWEPLPARQLLRRIAGRGQQDEVVPAQAQEGTCGRTERRLRLLERRRTHELRCRRGAECLRDVEQTAGLARAAARRLLSAPPLRVLEGETGVVGQASCQHEGLRPICRRLCRPDHAQHPSDVASDHDRDLEGAPATDEPERGVAVGRALRRRNLGEDRCVPGERLLETGDVAPRATGAGGMVEVGRLLVDEHCLVPGQSPELGELAVERGERLAADGLHDRLRPLTRETRREPCDPVEPFSQRELALVELRPLERLPTERGRELRQRHELRVDAAGSVEREAHRADHSLLRQERNGKRAVRVHGESRSIRKLALELLARVGERGSAGSHGLDDRRQCVEWDAKSGRQRGAPHTAWIDDHEFVSLHEAEGAADGSEERWQSLDECVRHLVGCRGGGELGCERSEDVNLGFDLAAVRHG